MTEQEIADTVARIHGADDPWGELMVWLQERSIFNQTNGVPDGAFISLIVIWVTQLSPSTSA
jgi:poly(A) polymerase Pap1